MRAIVADDEDLARSALVGLFRTCLPEVEIVGEASDGEEALHLYENHKPDIVVLDIKMPGDNGLDVAAKIRKQSGAVCIIILTAYDSFDFAQRAANTPVNGYLLKPVERDELVRLVTLWEIDNRDVTLTPFEKHTELRAIHSFAQAEAIQALFRQDAQRIPALLHLLSKTPEDRAWIILISTKNNPRLTHLRHSLEKNESVWQSPQGTNDLLVLFFSPNQPGKEPIQNLAYYCHQQLVTPPNPVKLLIHPRQSLNNFSSELHQEMRRTILAADEGITWMEPGAPQPIPVTLSSPLSSQGRKLILDWMQRTPEGNHDGWMPQIEAHLETVQAQVAEFPLFRNYCIELLVLAKETCYRKVAQEVFQQVSDYLDEVIGSRSIEECAVRCSQSMRRLLELIAVDTPIVKSWRLNMALEYIHEHLSDDLFLDLVADHAEVSPQHLSKLFRDEIGTSFNQYVTERRIEKAKFLLYADVRKVNEIAQMVGYRDSNYFTKVFRKCTGVTPNGYRNALMDSQ